MSTLDVSRPSMIVLPGGGYHVHAPHEAEPVAEWIESLGWAARIVRYPLETQHPAPLQAVRHAVREERDAGAPVVGVIGFSAGGHLAGLSLLAPDSTEADRPDLAILGYPVVTMLDGAHEGSLRALLGADPSVEARTAVSLEHLVTTDSRPMFLWHTAGDAPVPVDRHTYPLAAALARAHTDYELHVFPGDEHGIGLAYGTPAEAWTELAAAFLARHV